MISPKDASKKNDQDHAEQLKAAEEKIDKILARGYSSGGAVCIDTERFDLEYSLRERLIDRYRKSGWEVKHHSDQREQTCYYKFNARRGQFD